MTRSMRDRWAAGPGPTALRNGDVVTFDRTYRRRRIWEWLFRAARELQTFRVTADVTSTPPPTRSICLHDWRRCVCGEVYDAQADWLRHFGHGLCRGSAFARLLDRQYPSELKVGDTIRVRLPLRYGKGEPSAPSVPLKLERFL